MARQDKHKSSAGKVNLTGTGVYMAYPTTPVLKPIYRNLKTRVNDQHTKVGITTDSFANRRREYRNTFNGEVTFVPLAEIPVDRLSELETELLREMAVRFARVGRAREWFHTDQRAEVARIVMNVVNRQLRDQ